MNELSDETIKKNIETDNPNYNETEPFNILLFIQLVVHNLLLILVCTNTCSKK